MTAVLNVINNFCNEAYNGTSEVCKFMKEQTFTSIQNLSVEDSKVQTAIGHTIKLLAFTGGCISTALAAKTLLGFSALPLPATAALLTVSGVAIHDSYKMGSELLKTNQTRFSFGANLKIAGKETITYQVFSAVTGRDL
jgi:hypothetical protein